MKTIKSFQRDHNVMEAGLYLQETKKNVDVYDLRFVKPNTEYIEPAAVHSIEHMLATFLKSELCKISNDVVSLCVGGCLTMFYLEVFNESGVKYEDVKQALLDCIDWCLKQETVVGATEKECGNYKMHDLAKAKEWLSRYKQVLMEV